MNSENHVAPLIAFVHIPKAGGMSLTCLLANTYGERLFRADPERGWPQTFSEAILDHIAMNRFFYKAFIGHCAYGIHSVFDRQTRYFSIVREPLERLESYYNFVKLQEVHHHHQRAQDLSIDSFFSYLIDIDDIEVSNLQCLMIAGDKSLKLALDRADKDFELIIPLSRINDGVALLCEKLNMARRSMPEENTTAHVSKITNLRRSVYKKLLELNKGDTQLYGQVCQKFATLVS